MSPACEFLPIQSEEHVALGDSVNRYLTENYTLGKRRDMIASGNGFDREIWAEFADMGWLAVPFSETLGGLDGGVEEFAAIMPALGRALVLEPYLDAVVLAGTLLSASPASPLRDQLIETTICGQGFASVALLEPHQRVVGAIPQTRVHSVDGGWEITGHFVFVPFAEQADMVLVPARHAAHGDEISVYAVRPAEADIRSYATIDGGLAADMVLDAVRLPVERLISGPETAGNALARAIRTGTFCVCVEAVAIMDAIIQNTIEYMQTRKQFRQPLASFQALQHTLADMTIEFSKADAAIWIAGQQQLRSENKNQQDLLLAAAKYETGRAGRFIGKRAIQLHGGIGMTDEFIIGHYFKRLIMVDLLYGGSAYQLQRVTDMQ